MRSSPGGRSQPKVASIDENHPAAVHVREAQQTPLRCLLSRQARARQQRRAKENPSRESHLPCLPNRSPASPRRLPGTPGIIPTRPATVGKTWGTNRVAEKVPHAKPAAPCSHRNDPPPAASTHPPVPAPLGRAIGVGKRLLASKTHSRGPFDMLMGNSMVTRAIIWSISWFYSPIDCSISRYSPRKIAT